MDRSLLTIHNLTIGYDRVKKGTVLFNKLNLRLLAGQLVCFMGPNGIGKSTLIRTLAGLQAPISGHVTYDRNDSPELSKKVAVVLTDRISTANLTIGELITYGRYPYLDWSLRLSADDADIIERAIRQLRLEPLLAKKVYELSDGQLQMAMIARALAQNTPVILLDEPTAHLDLNNRVEIMNLLRKIAHDTDKAILVATHELDLALQTADLIWLTGLQQNILTGIPEDLVLNNTFDDVFRFKGYDLKTGKIQHESWRNIAIRLSGEDHAYLWTKNALERNGYRIVNDPCEIDISVIITENEAITWQITCKDQTAHVATLDALLARVQGFAYNPTDRES